MNEKEVTFNVKYEIVLYTPVFDARWAGVKGRLNNVKNCSIGRGWLPLLR